MLISQRLVQSKSDYRMYSHSTGTHQSNPKFQCGQARLSRVVTGPLDASCRDFLPPMLPTLGVHGVHPLQSHAFGCLNSPYSCAVAFTQRKTKGNARGSLERVMAVGRRV